MQSPSTREVTELCFHGCCPTPLFTLNETDKSIIPKPRNSSSENRRTFASTTSSCLFPNTEFNNSDSLPSLQEAFSQFINTYPNYCDTYQIDEVRAREYYNLSLSNHVCLDYIGIGLFSFSQLHNQLSLSYPSTSSSSPPPLLPPHSSDFPVFHLSYKSVNLKNQLLEGGEESKLESAIKKRIRDFLNISEDDYSVVLTANRTSAFRLVAESYPFGSFKKLLTVYDHDSEAIDTMISSSEKRGAQAMAAEFKWPRLRIHSSKLRSMITSKSLICKKRGLFVFQLQSRVTGARYSYQWMKVAQENGWHVLLDACAVGPKDMDSLGLSLFQPDFLVCSFYKVFGENPSGFGCLFVKKSTIPILEASTTAGIVSIVSARKLFYLHDESSDTETEVEHEHEHENENELELGSSSSNSFSGPIPFQATRMERGESSTSVRTKGTLKLSEIEVIEEETSDVNVGWQSTRIRRKKNAPVECRCLDHIDSLGLSLVNSRSRYLVNWLINGMTKLQHPNADKAVPLVKIYGPKVKFDRGPALAFNVFDWKGEKVEPILIQKLADRKSISLSYGFLHHIWFPEKYEQTKVRVVEKRRSETKENKRKEKEHLGIRVVTAAFGFIANFADAYKLWAFIAQFLDADFVEKERWRYTALNQQTLEI